MKIAISSTREKNAKLERHELIKSIQDLGYSVSYIVRDSNLKLHSDYNKYNVECLPIPIDRSNTNPLKEIKTVAATRKTLKENNIDFLIAYGIRTFPTVVMAARLAGVKTVLCIVNGSGRLFQLSGLKGFVVKSISYPMLCLAFLLSNNILFQNPDDKKMIYNKKILWKRNYDLINGSGVNLNEFKPTKLVDEPVFTLVSRITGSKGVNEFLKAANYISEKYTTAKFNLIGQLDDDDSSIDKLLLEESIKNGIVNFIGKVEDVRPYLKETRVFVLPSFYPEGIPRSILEAMAMGLPIITTDSPGCRETVVNKVNGFLIKPKDPYGLAEKMIWMIENRNISREMGIQSRKICEEYFDVKIINKKILETLGVVGTDGDGV